MTPDLVFSFCYSINGRNLPFPTDLWYIRPHTGQTYDSGRSTNLFPGIKPLAGSPRFSSYTYPQTSQKIRRWRPWLKCRFSDGSFSHCPTDRTGTGFRQFAQFGPCRYTSGRSSVRWSMHICRQDTGNVSTRTESFPQNYYLL